MAAETRVDCFLPAHCGEARGCIRNSDISTQPQQRSYTVPHATASSDPHLQSYSRNDKRVISDSRAQYHSWTSPHYPVPAHLPYPPSVEVSGPPPPLYGVHPMRVHMTAYPPGPPPPAMVSPALPVSYRPLPSMGPQQPTPRAGGRTDFTTDSSSSSCTPRDHYGVIEKSQHKKYSKKSGTPRIPVVKIPETLKKHGQPSPAMWLNSRGFPLRPGKPDCKHYISKGWCAYGTLCKFNHPDSASLPPCSMVSPYGPPPPGPPTPHHPTAPSHGMNHPAWVDMQSYTTAPPPPPQWTPWTTQQQMYPMTSSACYPHPSYACSFPTSTSPTASTTHSSPVNANGSESERATKDSETNNTIGL